MSVDELIRERLDTLVEPVDADAVLARVDQLAAGSLDASAASRRGHRSRTRAALGAAAAGAIIAAVGLGVARMADGSGQAEVLAGPESTASTGSGGAPVPTASVEVNGESLGAIEVTTSELIDMGEDHDVDMVASHELTFTNTGETTVYLDDLRTSAALSADPSSEVDLFAYTAGCGVSYGPEGKPVLPSCARDYDPIGELAPGESVGLAVFLRSASVGGAPRDDGERVFRFRVNQRDEPFVDPRQREGTVGDVVVTYRNLTTLES
jgi:hypothetical protein